MLRASSVAQFCIQHFGDCQYGKNTKFACILNTAELLAEVHLVLAVGGYADLMVHTRMPTKFDNLNNLTDLLQHNQQWPETCKKHEHREKWRWQYR